MLNQQPHDEWKLEQGLAPAELPLLDQTIPLEQRYKQAHAVPKVKEVAPTQDSEDEEDAAKADDIAAADEDPAVIFAEERPELRNWYVEWENYPEKKAKAHKILINNEFPPPPEFQLGPVPDTNPVLEGVRWKMWHKAVGGPLTSVPEESWLRVIQEKHPDMLHLLQFPYNGEPPKRLVTAKPVTPTSLHFVRNHGGVPDIDADKWELKMDGPVKHPWTFSVADLQNEEVFPRIEKLVTVQCSGTRRVEQIRLYAGEGDEMINAPWADGAIGTARYVGVSLKKVVKQCGGMADGGKHLEFYGADTYFKQNEVMNYLVSVPWSKVKADEVMLAWEMNGEALPRIHGHPVRLVAMGYIGARSVKWVYRIRALPRPSRAPVHSRDVPLLQPAGRQAQPAPDHGDPDPGDAGELGHHVALGQAGRGPRGGASRSRGGRTAAGGRWPGRVEVSADGGFNWYAVPDGNLSGKHKFAWRTWELALPCDAEGWVEVVVRCWDNSINTQPPARAERLELGPARHEQPPPAERVQRQQVQGPDEAAARALRPPGPESRPPDPAHGLPHHDPRRVRRVLGRERTQGR
ncbi:hypothetical protein LTS17_001944 [Exophiala oligosperma]